MYEATHITWNKNKKQSLNDLDPLESSSSELVRHGPLDSLVWSCVEAGDEHQSSPRTLKGGRFGATEGQDSLGSTAERFKRILTFQKGSHYKIKMFKQTYLNYKPINFYNFLNPQGLINIYLLYKFPKG